MGKAIAWMVVGMVVLAGLFWVAPANMRYAVVNGCPIGTAK